jgi:DNA-binding NarL/FixJ family response regulator
MAPPAGAETSVRVAEVQAQSAAERAGLKKDDEILAIRKELSKKEIEILHLLARGFENNGGRFSHERSAGG